MAPRSAKERQEKIQERRAEGKPRRGDRTAGHGKSPFGPKGGRNAGGRGAQRTAAHADHDPGRGREPLGEADSSPKRQKP